ncbi:hypothetical protein [Streptomyces sp. NBC_01217]|uniref:hypothetical protein n=1 Tax=Streptomyces sp. NBC_01217 TaxID=2903779 RepID=UPI002E168800|nr:hypothetical protein OG507_30320 [Streptomyces sp. NBC_01217]
MVQKPENDTEPKERRIDLSLPQVAGSAVAAVAAAVAASQLGVYGTILGAGVMSVVATCGGSVFQHFFRRTGEQICEVTVQAKNPGHEASASDTHETGDTRLLTPLDETRLLTAARPDQGAEFSEATTHGTRVRGWKRPALGAAVVFAVTMGGITTFELVSGNDLSGGGGTTVGSVVRGGERGSGSNDPAPETGTQGQTPGQEGGATPSTDPQGGQSPNPDSGQGDGSPSGATPSPTPSGSTPGRTDPSPAVTPSPAVPGDGSTTDPNPMDTGDAPAQGDPATADTDQ